MKKITIYMALLTLSFGLASCDYLDVEPVGKVIANKTTEYRALLTSGYTQYPYVSGRSFTALLSDEIGELKSEYILGAHTQESMPFTYTWRYGSNMYEYHWQFYYLSAFYANVIIDEVMDAAEDGGESREQLLGEAYALRAYNHFELTNLYGKWYDPATAATDKTAPISNNINIDQEYKPATVEKMYEFILDDLKNAQKYMTVEKQDKLNYRFSKTAAMALESRVRLYKRDWKEAYDAAKSVMASYALSDMNGIPLVDRDDDWEWTTNQVPDWENKDIPWKPTSSEAIFCLDRPFGGLDGDFIDIIAPLSDKMLDLFDTEDLRAKLIENKVYMWTFYLGKGLIRSKSDRSSIRLSEMYLNAAEAAVNIGTPALVSEAAGLLKDLMNNRLTPDGYAAKSALIDNMSAEELLQEIYDERAREFVMEGHRWFDLRRTTRPGITKIFEDNTYTLNPNDSRYTLPFPSEAINANPGLSQ